MEVNAETRITTKTYEWRRVNGLWTPFLNAYRLSRGSTDMAINELLNEIERDHIAGSSSKA